jgi:hypothetical protein
MTTMLDSGDTRIYLLQTLRDRCVEALQPADDTPGHGFLRASNENERFCPRLSAFDQLQQQFQFRVADGERLRLLSLDMDRSYQAGQYAQQ